MRFLNVYQITREFGGNEEGGWYYNNWECVCSVPLKYGITLTAEKSVIESFKKFSMYQDEGDIYSVNGGVEFMFLVENKDSESETKGRPHYE